MTDHQKAFQEFMLRGRRKSGGGGGGGDNVAIISSSPSSSFSLTTSTPKTPNKNPSSSSSSSSSPFSFHNKSTTASKKSMGPILKAIQGLLEQWKGVDSQLQAVLSSIANLRDRISWENQLLLEQDDYSPRIMGPGQGGSSIPSWQKIKSSGFRHSKIWLEREDIQLGLSHDLLQHEKMLAAVRTLISSLAQIQDSLGRRVDEWMLLQLSLPSSLEEGSSYSLVYNNIILVVVEANGNENVSMGLKECCCTEDVEQVYLFLAGELYRKQRLVQKVLDSCHDGVLCQKDETVKNGSPRSIARQCSRQWSSREKEESWLLVETLAKSKVTSLKL